MLKRMIAWVAVLTLVMSLAPQMTLGVTAEGSEPDAQAIPAAHSHSATQHDCAHCDEAIVWEAWGDTDTEKKTLPTASGHYYLVSDIEKTARTEMSADIVLCLNGYTIDGNSTDTIYRVVTSGKLRIDDCTAYTDAEGVYHAGRIINGKTTGGVGGTFYVNGTSTLTMTAGIIADSVNSRTTTDAGYGGGVLHLRNTAQVTLENVVFENCSTTKDGGIISKRDSGSKLTAKNCTFKGSTAGTQGGAAYITGGGGAAFESCTFTGNTASTGSALYLYKAGKVTLKDCVFEKNTAKSGASGTLYLYDADVEMDGCTIRDNTANGNGGSAVYMTYASSLSLKDCTLTGNNFTGTANSARGAVYVTKLEDKVTVSGKTVIEGNFAATGGTPVERGIFLQTTSAVDVGGLSDGAKISIRNNTTQTTANMVTAATAPTSWKRTWVVYENNGMAVEYDAANGFYFALNTDHVHCECGNSACTDTTHKKVEYVAWNDAAALPATGNYYLNTDVTMTAEASVSTDLNLCLNGHTVTAASKKRHMSTPANATVTITISDCTAKTVDGVYTSGGFTGGVDAASNGQGGGSIYIRAGGTLKIFDGTFTNNTSVTGGGAINTLASTTLIIYDGLFSGNTAVTTDGKTWKTGGAVRTLGNDAQILGGTFTGNTGSQGGALYSAANKLVVKDAAFADNYAYSNAGAVYAKTGDTTITNTAFTGNYGTKDGGALYYRDGKIQVKDCVFTDNESKTVGAAINFSGTAVATVTGGTFEGGKATAGGAAFVQGGATATFIGGTYKNNTTTTYGGAFSLYNGTLTVTGGAQITGNTAKRGGAIDLRETSSLTLKDCTITGNTASSGGAVYINSASALTLEGAPRIMANQGGNLYVMDAEPAKVGALTEGTNVCVTGNPGAFTEACENYADYFAADSKYLKVDFVDGALHLVAGGEHKHCLCDSTITACDHTNIAWVAWESTTSLPTSGSYYLLYDVQLTDEVSISKNLNLCLNGHTITAADGKRIMSTPTGADATISITDCTAAAVDGVYTAGKLTKGHNMEANVGGGAIYLRKGGKLNFYEGIVTENTAVAGGVLLVTTDTVTNIYGGLFTENFAKNGEEMGNGGVIYAMKGAEVNVYDGTFTNNDGKSGGVIYIDSDSKLTVSGGLFAGNTATTNAGAIYGKTAAVTITGGAYENNTSVKDGGALYYREGTIHLLGGTFKNNKSSAAGGAISFSGSAVATVNGAVIENSEGGSGGAMILQGGSTTTITDVTIRNNVSRKYGGAIYLYASTLTVNGGTFSGNSAENRGGGIYTCENATLTINGGTFKANHADINGGGIYGIATDMKVTGGKIINNTSLKDGAGIYYREGNMDISGDVLISGNQTKTTGGGVCYSGNATGTISGGIIEKNTCGGSGGGMIIQGQAKVTITGGIIRNHNVTKYGGAIQLYDSELTISGGEITGNKAATGAGAIYANQSKTKLTIAEGANISKNQSKNGGAVLAVNRAHVEMTGGKITGNTTQNGSGGGLYISTNCTFKMTGGSISGNTVTGAAGGIYLLRATGTFSGGSIYGNTANGAGGGGIYMNGATAYVYGTSITGNTTKGNGGGIGTTRNIVKKNGVETASYSCTLVISGAYIANNSAKIAGGVIMNGNGGKMTMSGTTITGNKATSQAGGLYVSAKCTATITGGSISNNTSAKSGGGMYTNKTAVGTITGTKFLNNKSEGGAGGGMYLYRGTLMDFKDILVEGNTCTTVGGGIYADSHADHYTEVTFDNCTFRGNTAGTRGGAFYGSFGVEFDAVNCLFEDNTAVGGGDETTTGNGGAIAIRDIARLKDCIFRNNKAQKGGAFYGGNMQQTYAVNGWGTKADEVGVTLENCTFEGNDASETGGAMHNAMSSFATLTNCSFTGNSSGTQGSAIYAEDDMKLIDVTITGNVAANDGYALFYADSEYDTQSYIRGLFKLGGDIIVKDNEGGDAYLDNQVTITMTGDGLGAKTYMEVTLDKGVLTQRVIGAYNYEGGNQVYTVTYGNRSLTEPEVDETLPVIGEKTGEAQQSQQPVSTQDILLYVGIGIVALAAVAGAVLVILKKKKSAAAEKK